MAENAKVYCTSCGAACQRFSAGWRCPWATSSHRTTAWLDGEQVTSCASPFERQRAMVIPTETRTR